MKKILIILPTLNEANNINKLFLLIKKLKLNLNYLFIDHGSIDGTKNIIELIKKKIKKKFF